MTKPPLERAARALCRLDGHPEDARMDGKPLWQDYLPEVRAVLAAIREPDSTMESAVYKAAEEIDAQFDMSPDDVWRTMIDAIQG